MDQRKFTKDEFAKECVKRGYVWSSEGGKNAVLGWCKKNPKEFYTESDLYDIYRYFDAGRYTKSDTSWPYSHSRDWTNDPM